MLEKCQVVVFHEHVYLSATKLTADSLADLSANPALLALSHSLGPLLQAAVVFNLSEHFIGILPDVEVPLLQLPFLNECATSP